jgi:hypothetical protein
MKRQLLSLATMVFMLIAASTFVAGEALAAGGGCRYYNYPVGFKVNSCVSAAGNYAFADAYVDAVPSGCSRVEARLIERNGNWYTPKVTSSWSPCRTGYFGPNDTYMTPGLRYFNEVCIVVNGIRSYCSDSPEVWR